MEIEPEIYSKRTFFARINAPAMVNRHDVDYDIAPHSHEFFEIALCESGNGGHITANGVQMLTGGDLVIIRPGAWHGFTRCDHLIVHNCCFDRQLLDRELGWLREDIALNFLLWTGPYMGDRRGVMVVRLKESCLAGCLEYWEALRLVQSLPRRVETLGRLLILLDSLVCAVDELDIMERQARPIHPAVLETMRLLESQINQCWSLGDLAEHSHLNPSYLVRLFKAEIGLAPIAYLNHCRVERAAGLLLHTMLPVAEVAAHVGWYDPNLFGRRFRLAYGMSPSDYRKRFARSEE